MSRSHTTRAKRGDGRDSEYIYCDENEFRALLESEALVEHTEYAGTLYGTSKDELYRIIKSGKIPLLVLDFEGIKSLKSKASDFDVISVYIYTSLDEIEKRLYSRMKSVGITAESLSVFERRRSQNISDYLDIEGRSRYFDFIVENSDLKTCAEEIFSIVTGEKFSSSKPQKSKREIIDEIYLDAKRKSEN